MHHITNNIFRKITINLNYFIELFLDKRKEGSKGRYDVIFILGDQKSMKKPKTVKPFFFKDLSHKEMVDIINRDIPISLKYNESLINRVHARYPIINKIEVSLIIKGVFQSIRDLLVLGKVLNFNNLFFDTKLFFFNYKKNGHILPSLRVKISTPPPMKLYGKRNE